MKIKMNFNEKVNNNDDNIVIDKPIEDVQEFEKKLRTFENQGYDEIRELAKQQTVEQPKLIEKEQDPLYNFFKKVIDGQIALKELKKYSKTSCKRCYGRGYEGHQIFEGKKIPIICRCVAKKLKNNKELLKKALGEKHVVKTETEES